MRDGDAAGSGQQRRCDKEGPYGREGDPHGTGTTLTGTTVPATESIFESGIGITPSLGTVGGLSTEGELNRSPEGSTESE